MSLYAPILFVASMYHISNIDCTRRSAFRKSYSGELTTCPAVSCSDASLPLLFHDTTSLLSSILMPEAIWFLASSRKVLYLIEYLVHKSFDYLILFWQPWCHIIWESRIAPRDRSTPHAKEDVESIAVYRKRGHGLRISLTSESFWDTLDYLTLFNGDRRYTALAEPGEALYKRKDSRFLIFTSLYCTR